ncbi:hypothetical protein [Methanoculleus sp.]|jgi:hypothetical protein|nr:hypothetical protein [Methanoculleus sp.]MCK9319605.1 hypothetical protein [Methanoculleus sp.]
MEKNKILLVKFANRLKDELDQTGRSRIFYQKGIITKKIDRILEEFLGD